MLVSCRRLWLVAGGAFLVLAVLISGVGVPDGLVQEAVAAAPASDEPSVEGHAVPRAKVVKGAEDAAKPAKRAEPAWPRAGTAEIAVPSTQGLAPVASLPVQVGRAKPPAPTAGSSKAAIEATETKTASLTKVRVQVLDDKAVRRIGGIGFGVRLTRADGGTTSGIVTVSLDYSGFRDAYSGGFASRLTLIELPSCVLTTTFNTGECAKQIAGVRQIPVSNDVRKGTLTAELNAAPASTVDGMASPASPTAKASAVAGTGPVYVIASSTSSTSGDSTGSFAATDLKPSGTWQVGLSGGGFTYSYPIPTAPSPGGSAPKLSLDYSSSAVDSLTALTNNQASVIGMGWEIGGGYIEQEFDRTISCQTTGSQHLCWQSTDSAATPGLVLSVGGRSSRIVRDATSGAYKTVEDFGWKIESIATGAESGKAYWRVTTQDGTVYRFGYHRDAAWQVPYLGDGAGEPCHDKYPASPDPYMQPEAFCYAPWRWMLDQEIDPKGNVVDYTWAREENAYCRAPGNLCNSAAYRLIYDRGGYLSEISYGQNVNVAGSLPTGRVTFATVNREQASSGTSLIENDTPTDLIHVNYGTEDKCDSSNCPATGPSYFITKRLDTVTSAAWNPASTAWDDVTRLELGYSWIYTDTMTVNGNTIPTRPVLWLNTIRTVGLAGDGPDIAMPVVDFDATVLDNRRGATSSQNPAVRFPRIAAVNNGLGGRTEVSYGQPSGCALSDETKATARDDEGSDCYWVYKNRYYDANNVFHVVGTVWNKWLVTQVLDRDLVAASPDMVTQYEYVGRPAWAREAKYGVPSAVCWDPPQPNPPPCVNWSGEWTQFRGYQTVRVVKGAGTDMERYSTTSTSFFRGLYEDTLANGTPKHTQVSDFDGNAYDDLRVLSGRALQDQTLRRQYLPPEVQCTYPAWVSGGLYNIGNRVTYNNHHWEALKQMLFLTTPPAAGANWKDLGSCPTVTPIGYDEQQSTRYEYANVVTGNGPGIGDPHMVNQTRQVARQKVTSGWRYTEAATTYNSDGLPVKVNDYGERGNGGDNTCATMSYARNTDNGQWITALPSVMETHKGDDCAAGEVIGRTATLYDGGTDPATNKPTRGDQTESRTWTDATHVSTEKTLFDGYGRPTSVTDARGKVTSITYAPAVGYPVDGITRTNPLGYVQTAWLSPMHGGVVGVRDPNNRDANIDYDALGRTTALWTHGQPKSGGTPAAKITYAIPFDGNLGQPTSAASVRVDKLLSGAGASAKWISSISFEDGLGRLREEQMPSPVGGRMIKITAYDERGLEVVKSAPLYNSATAGAGLLNPAISDVPSWVKTVLDGLERQTAKIQYGGAAEVRRTTTAYTGMDQYTVTPPLGGKTTYATDPAGKITKISEQSGSQWLDSVREYDVFGNLTKTVDANGNIRMFTYDWARHPIASSDPDFGSTTAAYDAAGNQVSTTDAEGVTISTVYDDLGRKIEQWQGNPGSGTKLAEWVFDTLVKGKLTSATRWTGGQPYTDAVTAYDAGDRPTGSTLTIPPAEGLLAGTYTFSASYDKVGREVTKGLPAAGGLPAETITTTSSDVGLTTGLSSDFSGGFTYLKDTLYSPTGKLLSRTFGASGRVIRTLTWDSATNQLTSLKTVSSAGSGTSITAQDDVYSYDTAGALTSIVDKTTIVGGTVTPQTECFSYDERRRLASAFTTTQTCTAGANGFGPDPYKLAYTYDAAGNIKTITDSGTTRTYNYPQSGAAAVRPNAVTSIAGPSGTETYTYDSRGQLASQDVGSTTTTYEWNQIGQLAKATTAGNSVEMVYGADGKRLIRREADKTVLYLGVMELELANGQVTGRRYYQTPDGATVAMRVGGQAGVTWLLAGRTGSEELSIDDASGSVSRQKYLPFGGRRGGRDDLSGTDRGFLGKVEDNGSGLVNLDARYYSPSMSKFISTDPLLGNGAPDLANPYSYSGNNPLNLSDPTGLYPQPADGSGPCLRNDPNCPLQEDGDDALDVEERDQVQQQKQGASPLLSELNSQGIGAALKGEDAVAYVARKGQRRDPRPRECWGVSNAICLLAFYVRDWAFKLSGTKESTPDGCKKKKHSCKKNAMRHCIMQVALTDMCGAETAKKIGDNHESDQDPNSWDSKIDRHNNAVSRRAVRWYNADKLRELRSYGDIRNDPKLEQKYWNFVKEICETLWDDGQLW
ncbi:hypothetical protein N5079_06945 [Planotetraspora sp. A-T 1434]|uniref:RHS repeat-associated core domain-containing protein n=1 Tax=Planotetraspora sp. A-T 1434 TaxID=2979219 RepID=UPI0021C243CA|nr:RHS repeat-associated core domain-containing protein [Planotetraspora sp. A-T 1434]MCT9929956.1 hypothetical protein [Planotetraspora sp. A-T 1434]